MLCRFVRAVVAIKANEVMRMMKSGWLVVAVSNPETETAVGVRLKVSVAVSRARVSRSSAEISPANEIA